MMREFLQERAWLLILKYENDWSYRTIANTHGVGKDTVRKEIDKGLAYLDGKIEALAGFDNEKNHVNLNMHPQNRVFGLVSKSFSRSKDRI